MRWLLASLVVAGCGSAPLPDPVRLQTGSLAGKEVLSVVPADHLRINARVPPAIELAAGGVIRIARGRVSRDSSYFLEPPWELRPVGAPVRGRLRVGYCRAEETLCRTVTIPVDLEEQPVIPMPD